MFVSNRSIKYSDIVDRIHNINKNYDLLVSELEWISGNYTLKTKVKLVHYNCEANNNENYYWESQLDKLFNSNKICPCCKSKDTYGRYTNELFIKKIDEIYKGEFTLLSEFKGLKKNIKVRHNNELCNNYEYEVRASRLLKKETYCPICSRIKSKDKISESNTKSTDTFKKEVYDLVKDEYTVLGEYTKCDEFILIRHNCNDCNNYEYNVRPRDFITKGNRCPKCSHKTSKEELELKEFIKSFYNKTILFNERGVLNGKELDIYLPDDKIAIEYDGLYWHSDEYKDKDYHLNKTKECEDLNIHLIQIFSDEWIFKKDIVKNKIKHILGYDNGIKVYARNCIVKEVKDKKIKNDFLEKNHIQGKYDHSFLSLGLYYNDDLVSIMTFRKELLIRTGKSKNNISNKDNIIEIARYANNLNYRIIGGFGKLFSYFISNYSFDEIITYADRRYSFKNNVYSESSYFKFDSETKPSYYYISNKDHNEVRYNRTKFTKGKLIQQYPEYINLTESQIMEDKLNYKRIYDCGNLKYIYKKRD